MYKVLLVDDEYLIRDAISRNTPWHEADFELVGTAENGKQAITLIEEHQPNLVLTDICMPIMDGIELAAFIHQHYPEIKVIIISGYDDFEYAKQALKYEVSDYILKPITSVELVEELQKVKVKLDAVCEKQIQVEKIQREYEKNIPTLRGHFLNRLIEGSYKKNDILQQMNHFDIKLAGAYQAVVMVEVEDASAFLRIYPDTNADLIDFSLANISSEIVEGNENIIFFQNTENKTLFVFSEEQEDLLQELVEQVCSEIVMAMQRYMKTKVCILVGHNVNGPENWASSYASVIRAQENKFLLEEHMFVYGKDFMGARERGHIQTSKWIDKLVLMIKLNQLEELEETGHEMFQEFRESGCERKVLLIHIQNIVLTILINLEDTADSISEHEGEVEFIHHLSDYKHLSDVETRFLEFCKKLSEDIAGRRESTNQKQAVLALDYIEKNYMNVNMSLNMVCAHLCVSTSYFSTIFKSATGETFIEALTRVRMEKARRILETSNMKSYEVALSVGYNDPHYFSSIFKKHMGVTPTEYAKQLRK